MNLNDIETALDLHQKAFGFLLACRASGHAGSRPFDENTVAAWKSGDRCIDWVTRNYDQLPSEFRPAREDIGAFAQLLSSLFSTSFSMSKTMRDGRPAFFVRALPTRRPDGSKKSAHAKSKERNAAQVLRQGALEALAEACGISCTARLATFDNDPAAAADLTLWTYAIQLVNRAHYASQGPAVYQLWLDLPEKTRRDFTAERVWQARQRLAQHLQSTNYSSNS